MKRFLLRRLALMIPVLFLVTLFSFVLLRLTPGDPVVLYAGLDADPAYVQQLRSELGLDRPLPIQYLAWLCQVAQGDLGVSFIQRRPVAELIGQAIPRTLELGLVALAFHATLAISIGLISALKKDSWLDFTTTGFALVLISIPSFVVGFALIAVFSLAVRLLPPGGYVPFSQDPIGHLKTLVLPAIAVGAASLASIMRQTRSALLEVLDDDYIRTARAKGLGASAVILRHALRNALIPVATIIGLQIGSVLEGAFIVETIFSWPGLGRLTVESISSRDYAVVQGAVMVTAVSFLVSTLVTDIAYAWLDPRISFGSDQG